MSWTKITNELDKEGYLPSLNDHEAEESETNMSSASAPHVFPMDFQLCPSSGGRVSGNPN
ncbi:hypothetical protein DY000_02056665 [Brassica cretica]|uniref:Uncharacterized protein n=1 Tax=Brassica cretica TaxID=69181 RepID=A0ABQ7ACT1_BRACR|nr:hypothetical protein DY000_02056665 [Brassica cretica]